MLPSRLLYTCFTLVVFVIAGNRFSDESRPLAPGHLPVVVADGRGVIHLTFGRDSTIFYASSTNEGQSFTVPVGVAVLPNLVAGATRGPQVAVTNRHVVITAVNKAGNVFACQMNRATGKWTMPHQINDVPDVAKEGFQAVVGTSGEIVHTVWLDLRGNGHNKLVGTISTNGGGTWSANRVIYASPSGTVCECCRVSVAAAGKDVYVLFRNALNGARDLYLAHSGNAGQTYDTPQKMGNGTWKLAGCPMDGGGLALTTAGKPLTIWRREGTVYQVSPGEEEQVVSAGKNGSIASGVHGSVLVWEAAGIVYVKSVNKPAIALGTGQIPTVAVTGKAAVVVWENKGQIQSATVAI